MSENPAPQSYQFLSSSTSRETSLFCLVWLTDTQQKGGGHISLFELASGVTVLPAPVSTTWCDPGNTQVHDVYLHTGPADALFCQRHTTVFSAFTDHCAALTWFSGELTLFPTLLLCHVETMRNFHYPSTYAKEKGDVRSERCCVTCSSKAWTLFLSLPNVT